MKTLPITFGIALFAIAMISATAFNDASAVSYDGTLTKFTSDGKYKIDMAWSPAGSLEPGVEYDFTFKISQGATDRAINFISFDLGVVENGILTSDDGALLSLIVKLEDRPASLVVALSGGVMMKAPLSSELSSS